MKFISFSFNLSRRFWFCKQVGYSSKKLTKHLKTKSQSHTMGELNEMLETIQVFLLFRSQMGKLCSKSHDCWMPTLEVDQGFRIFSEFSTWAAQKDAMLHSTFFGTKQRMWGRRRGGKNQVKPASCWNSTKCPLLDPPLGEVGWRETIFPVLLSPQWPVSGVIICKTLEMSEF